MNFYEWFFLEEVNGVRRAPAGLFSLSHILTVTLTLAALLTLAVFLGKKFKEYQKRMEPLLDEEVEKLITLQDKHKKYYQLTLFEHERKLEEKERSVDELFEEFINWVTETLTIQDNPYIRIITVLTGVAS